MVVLVVLVVLIIYVVVGGSVGGITINSSINRSFSISSKW